MQAKLIMHKVMQEASDVLSKPQTVTLFPLSGLFSAVSDRQEAKGVNPKKLKVFFG